MTTSSAMVLAFRDYHYPSNENEYKCYKLIQRLRVTYFIAGQYNTVLLWLITGLFIYLFILREKSR